MHRSWQRPVLTLLTALALATSGAVALSAPAQAAVTDIRINEVESSGGVPGDWVELTNIGATTTDLGGLKFKDGDDSHAFYTIPDGTMLAPGAFVTLEELDFVFGLGGADSARLFASDGTTVIDSFTWATAAAGTWSRCPDGTGAFVDTSSTKAASNSCAPPPPTSIKLNEVESDMGTPGDWVELKNTGGSSVDISGLKLKDSDDAHDFFTVPASTVLTAGGYYVADVDATFGLGSVDSIRLFGTDGTTLLDTYTWATHATTTYGRCPDGTGDFTTTQVVTRGALNNCPGDIVAGPWPGGPDVSTDDVAGTFSSNLSGLTYQGSGTNAPGTLWAVRNGSPEALYKLVKSGSNWVPDTGDWAAGKQLRYPNGTGNPDAEGVTFTEAGPAGGAFVSTERDNSNSGVSRPAILRFDPNASGTTLAATNDWNLTADLPGLGANLGLEGIAWVPDGYLVAKDFKTSGGTAYNPADYPNHGNGLFFVGVENDGMVYAYALDLTGSTYTRVASFASGFPAVMEVHFEKETQQLWVVCDDSCQGRSARFDVVTAAGPDQGTFKPVGYYERPAGMANLNNEGFTTTGPAECVDGLKPVFWSDDGNTGGNSLRQGSLSCSPPTSTQIVTFTSTQPAPVVGQQYPPTASTDGASGNPVVISVSATPADACSVTAGVVTFAHPGSCVVQANQAGNDQFLPGSAQQTITVQKANTTTTVKPRATTIEATVAALAPGAGTPTGTVLFAVDGTPVGGGTITGGTASVSFTIPHDGAAHSVTAAYQGNADFNGSAKVLDRTDPEITASISAAGGTSPTGWYHAAVTVTFTCTPHGAALAACPPPVTLSTSGADQAVIRTVTAVDGGSASVTASDIDIDLDAPVVSIGGVKAGKTYQKKQKPTCKGSDSLSGLASCTVTQVRTGTKYVVTATATDQAGNVSSSSLTYKVRKPKK